MKIIKQETTKTGDKKVEISHPSHKEIAEKKEAVSSPTISLFRKDKPTFPAEICTGNDHKHTI